MIVGSIDELSVVDVYERGRPNEERIILRVNQKVQMGQYGLMLGNSTGNKNAVPVQDNMFWFGDGFAHEGDWIFLYTGKGVNSTTPLKEQAGNLYSTYWGKQTTVFGNTVVVPILFRVDAVNIGTPLLDQTQ